MKKQQKIGKMATFPPLVYQKGKQHWGQGKCDMTWDQRPDS